MFVRRPPRSVCWVGRGVLVGVSVGVLVGVLVGALVGLLWSLSACLELLDFPVFFVLCMLNMPDFTVFICFARLETLEFSGIFRILCCAKLEKLNILAFLCLGLFFEERNNQINKQKNKQHFQEIIPGFSGDFVYGLFLPHTEWPPKTHKKCCRPPNFFLWLCGEGGSGNSHLQSPDLCGCCSNSWLVLCSFVYTVQMDAEDLGRKLLLTLWKPPKSPHNHTVATVATAH